MIAIADFHDRHSGVAIHFVEGTQDEMLAQIRADELDAIFTAVDPDALDDEFALVWRARRRRPPAAKAFLALAIARGDAAAVAPLARLVA